MKDKPPWLKRAINTYNYHISRYNEDNSWTLSKTAKALRRPIGPISEDIQVAIHYKINPDKVLSFKFMIQALEWIKERKKQADLISD